jgi:CubicO group peptidase (beta-lactamase class C family)
MHRRRLTFLTALLIVTITAGPRADETDDYIKTQLDRFHLPGLSLVVLKDGKIIKAAAYGFSDRERRTPATTETVYKIGSVSKQFIATGIMVLVQEGRLGVDDPISRYLDGSPPAWQPITVRHLLTHTAGIVRESPAFDPWKVQSDADVVKATYGVPLRFVPGSKWEYCNTGYFALAQIITRVSGRPWQQFLEEKVFKPAGMTVTAPTSVSPTLPNRALGYTGNDNQRPADDWPALRPSGAFLSTVLDLAKWDALLYTDTILTEASRRQMWTPVQLTGGSTADYGFGWHVTTRNGRRVVSHGGGLPGFVSQFVRFVDDGVTVVVLTNGDDVDIQSVAMGVATRYLPVAIRSGAGMRPGQQPRNVTGQTAVVTW